MGSRNELLTPILFESKAINFYIKKICNKVKVIRWMLVCDLEKAMAPHSSTLAWKIPWVEEPGRLQSMGSRRVGHD